MGLLAQVRDAKQRVKALKNTWPWLFKEYHDLTHAKARLMAARREYREARRRWQELGK